MSYTTDYYPPDSTLFDAITGTDGDEAVFPYRSQHSSDLYESNGDTIDNAYMNYGIIGWTPEMDTCVTLGEPSNCNQFASPDDEGVVAAVFNKNLQFALNVDELAAEPRSPEELRQRPEPLPGQGARRTSSRIASTCPTARRRPVEATIRKELGPSYVTATVVGQSGTVTVADGAGARGRALRRGQGLLLRAPPGDHPGDDRHPRDPRR